MKVYFINLERSPERLAWFKKQAEGMGLNLVRVPAVDGRELSATELERWRKLCRKNKVLSSGELGCFLSHRKAWEMVRDGAEKWAFVAEDDIHFSKDAATFLTGDSWIPAEADLIKAETDLRRHEFSSNSWPAPDGHELRRLKSDHLGSGGYFLTREAAVHLLALTERRCEVADGVLFAAEYMQKHRLKVLQIIPAICIQDVYVDQHMETSTLGSIIDRERIEERKITKKQRMTFTTKLKREMRRITLQMTVSVARIYRMLVRSSVLTAVEFDRYR